MTSLILNNDEISTDVPVGTTVLDFVRYHKNLKGTKIGCREGDCGACTILVGELIEGRVRYRTMTSCLMPMANAAGKHIVTIEGVNPTDGSLTPVQQAMLDENGTQCGFCTVGFVMSLTGFCVDDSPKTTEMAVSAIDGNICRCTGYKSIERAAASVSRLMADGSEQCTPNGFDGIAARLGKILSKDPQSEIRTPQSIVGGGTDVYVQNPDALVESDSSHVFYDKSLRGITVNGSFIEMGASTTVTDMLESPLMQSIFPGLYRHLKLVSSTPIRNMATLAGNFINASPIGDMTVWFLALDAEIVFNNGREMPLRKLFLDYKKLAKTDQEFIRTIRFPKPGDDFRFNFEKVCKRTYLDIASVNTAISLTVESAPGKGWIPPVLRGEPGYEFESSAPHSITPNTTPSAEAADTPPKTGGELDDRSNKQGSSSALPLMPTQGHGSNPGALLPRIEYKIISAHVSAGGVAPVPLYLRETSDFLKGQIINAQTIADANTIMQAEITPISDVRGSADYKRLLLRQLFRAHFVELFDGPRN